MKNVNLFLAGSIFVSVLVGACGGSGSSGGTGTTCPTASTLTYANFGQAFMQNYCLECHATRESPILSTQAQVQAALDELDAVAGSGPNGTNTSMPQGRSCPTAERVKLSEWLACGAP